MGELLPGVARELGLGEGAIVHGAMNDSHAGALATGAHVDGRGGLMIGTTSVLLDTVDHKDLDADHEILSMPSPIPGLYLVWAENGISGRAVEHVLEHVVYANDALGDHLTDDHFRALDSVIRAVAPGSGKLLFLPWLSGSLSPEVKGSMRGAFLNLSLDTTRSQLVRAMVEGTAFNFGWLVPFVESFSGRSIDEVVFGGGAARSDGWAQILADILDRPVVTLVSPETAVARAVALCAAHGVAQVVGDVERLVETAQGFAPDPGRRSLYDGDAGAVRGLLRGLGTDLRGAEWMTIRLGGPDLASPGREDPGVSSYPYAERFGVNRSIPSEGRPREEVLEELSDMAREEDCVLGDGSLLGDHVLRRPRPLRLHDRGVRAASRTSTRSSATCAPAPPVSRVRSSP